jgi:hypothetical protein
MPVAAVCITPPTADLALPTAHAAAHVKLPAADLAVGLPPPSAGPAPAHAARAASPAAELASPRARGYEDAGGGDPADEGAPATRGSVALSLRRSVADRELAAAAAPALGGAALDEATANLLAREAAAAAGPTGRVAVVALPEVMEALEAARPERRGRGRGLDRLFELDVRYASKFPGRTTLLALGAPPPRAARGAFDVVVAEATPAMAGAGAPGLARVLDLAAALARGGRPLRLAVVAAPAERAEAEAAGLREAALRPRRRDGAPASVFTTLPPSRFSLL